MILLQFLSNTQLKQILTKQTRATLQIKILGWESKGEPTSDSQYNKWGIVKGYWPVNMRYIQVNQELFFQSVFIFYILTSTAVAIKFRSLCVVLSVLSPDVSLGS